MDAYKKAVLMSCPLCQRIKNSSYGYLIHEFQHSKLYLGEHQFYPGYCVLVSKHHHVEMADVPSPAREEIFQEMMRSSKAIQVAMKPKKMNIESLGNVVEHLHWHFFPRYANDPNFLNPVWLQMKDFESAKITSTDASEVIARIRSHLV